MRGSSSMTLNEEWEKGGRGLVPVTNGTSALVPPELSVNGGAERAESEASASAAEARIRELRRRGPDGKVAYSVSPKASRSPSRGGRKTSRIRSRTEGVADSD